MTDLPDFLAARIYEDECTAREIGLSYPGVDTPANGREWKQDGYMIMADTPKSTDGYVLDVGVDGACWTGLPEHVARWDPARVLLECQAKRGILLHYMAQKRRAEALNRAHADNPAIFYPEPWDLSLRYLALPYRDHPDWQESWQPPEPGTVETWGRR